MNNSALIKVLLVDDSPVALKILERILSSAPDIRVVGKAMNGKEGLELTSSLNPDVICTDLHMPVMNGLEFTREIMTRYPRPVLVISVSVQEGSENVFRLLEAGAVDVFLKPRGFIESEFEKKALELISKVKVVAGVHVFHRHPKKVGSEELGVESKKLSEKGVFTELRTLNSKLNAIRVVAIGASTGGPQILHSLLSVLPANFPLPVVCVQHIGDEFLSGFIEWLSSQCRMKVRIADSGEFPQPGIIYFPQVGSHLRIDNNGRFVVSEEPPYDGHRPSISVMLSSVAGFYGSKVMALLLTGMGRDGAEGMQAVSRAGGITIAQDEESSVVFGMPRAAIELGAAKYVMTPDEMGETLLKLGVGRKTK